jgi:hypothetical protein
MPRSFTALRYRSTGRNEIEPAARSSKSSWRKGHAQFPQACGHSSATDQFPASQLSTAVGPFVLLPNEQPCRQPLPIAISPRKQPGSADGHVPLRYPRRCIERDRVPEFGNGYRKTTRPLPWGPDHESYGAHQSSCEWTITASILLELKNQRIGDEVHCGENAQQYDQRFGVRPLCDRHGRLAGIEEGTCLSLPLASWPALKVSQVTAFASCFDLATRPGAQRQTLRF